MRAADNGVPDTTLVSEYYSQRTTKGGLLISEGVIVDPREKGITQAVHEKGGIFFAQIWHVGRVSVPSQTGGFPPLASVTTPLPGTHVLFGSHNTREPYVPSQAMSEADIASTLHSFSTAATNAIRAGFDGVEIHSENGYLLDTLLHPSINTLPDHYGGSLSNRLQFPLQVVDAVVGAISAAKIETFGAYVRGLEERSLAYVHIVEPRYDQLSTEGAFSGSIKRDTEQKPQVHQELTIWPFREILKRTALIAAGGFSAESARSAIEEGRADAVAFGRDFTSNPDLPRRMLEGCR